MPLYFANQPLAIKRGNGTSPPNGGFNGQTPSMVDVQWSGLISAGYSLKRGVLGGSLINGVDHVPSFPLLLSAAMEDHPMDSGKRQIGKTATARELATHERGSKPLADLRSKFPQRCASKLLSLRNKFKLESVRPISNRSH